MLLRSPTRWSLACGFIHRGMMGMEHYPDGIGTKAATFCTGKVAIEDHNCLCDQFLRQSQQDAGSLCELCPCEAERCFQVGRDIVESRASRGKLLRCDKRIGDGCEVYIVRGHRKVAEIERNRVWSQML